MTYAKNLVCGPFRLPHKRTQDRVGAHAPTELWENLHMQRSRSATATHGTYNDRVSREEGAIIARTSAGGGPRSP